MIVQLTREKFSEMKILVFLDFFFLSKYYVIDPQEAGSSGIGSHWPDKSFAPGV